MNNLLAAIINSKYTIIYPQVDKFLKVDLPELPNFHTLKSQSPRINNTGQLLARNIKLIQQSFPPPIAVMPFKPSAKAEKICQKQNWLFLANPAKINRLLEDKIKFTKLCDHYQLPTIPHLIAPFDRASCTLAQRQFGPKIILQTHFGWAGNSTFYFEKYADISDRITKKTVCKFSPFLQGYTLTNNCCLTKYGLIQSPAGRQLTGLTDYTQNPFATVGRQWPSFAPKTVLNQVEANTQKVSRLLKTFHYRGFFGIDFFVYQNQVKILEINPRLTASFGFYTDLETNARITPLLFFHLAEFLPLNYHLDLVKEQSRINSPLIVGTEITPKDKFGKTIAQYHQKNPIVKN